MTLTEYLSNLCFITAATLAVLSVGWIEYRKYRTKKAQWKRMLDDN